MSLPYCCPQCQAAVSGSWGEVCCCMFFCQIAIAQLHQAGACPPENSPANTLGLFHRIYRKKMGMLRSLVVSSRFHLVKPCWHELTSTLNSAASTTVIRQTSSAICTAWCLLSCSPHRFMMEASCFLDHANPLPEGHAFPSPLTDFTMGRSHMEV